ncbi:ParA family protein [Streptosporangium sp. NPDC000563]|uniref:ParA family protein n=1 Tax=Streptosporangium sp. NPDC000563 TaxID=3154366 RepID=UPI00331B4FBB
MTAIVASISSLKGGVGKTTTTANLGATAADTYGLRVLIADGDPQGHLSDWFGIERQAGRGFAELLNPPTVNPPGIRDCLIQASEDVSLWVLPTSYSEMDEVESRLSSDSALGGIWSINRVLQPVLEDFDLILLDTRPTLGQLTSAAMCTSNVVIPITDPRVPAFQSTVAAVQKAERIKTLQNPALAVTGWILNRWEEHEEGRAVADLMRKNNIAAFQPVIGVGEYIPKAYMYGNPAVWQFPNHRGPHRNYAELTGNILAAVGLAAGVA